MTARATLVSAAARRLRFRFPEHRHDPQFFDQLVHKLSSCPHISGVETNTRTASLVVYHNASLESIERYGIDHQLFTIEREGPTGTPSLSPSIKDQRVTFPSRELYQSLGMALLGCAALQAARGKFLPAGLTLIFQAAQFLGPNSHEIDPPPGDH